MQRFHRAVERRAFPVHPVDHEDHGPTELRGELPDLVCLDLHSGDGVENDQDGVRGGDSRVRFGGENAVTRSVEEIDTDVAVDGVRDTQVDRDVPLDLFSVEVGRARSILDPAGSRRGARRMQKRRDERGFSDCVMAHNRDVAQFGRRENLHGARL